MGFSLRAYIFAEDGTLQRVSKRMLDTLTSGQDAVPEFAGTRKKVATAIVESEDGKPVRIAEVQGAYWTFDEDGKIHQGLFDALREWMEVCDFGMPKGNGGTVVSLMPKIKPRDVEARHRWEPGKEDIDRIVADVFSGGSEDAGGVPLAKGTKPKRPPLTYEAEMVLREITDSFYRIGPRLRMLSEPALKGLAFEARSLAGTEDDGELWLGLAQACDRLRELRSRQRTGRGIWYAVLESTSWEVGKPHVVEVSVLAHERCKGQKAAVEAARRLLREHAGTFSARVSIEAFVRSDLEWRPEDDEGPQSGQQSVEEIPSL